MDDKRKGKREREREKCNRHHFTLPSSNLLSKIYNMATNRSLPFSIFLNVTAFWHSQFFSLSHSLSVCVSLVMFFSFYYCCCFPFESSFFNNGKILCAFWMDSKIANIDYSILIFILYSFDKFKLTCIKHTDRVVRERERKRKRKWGENKKQHRNW